ncbi:hypothetical protein [Sinomonas atrocyanea]
MKPGAAAQSLAEQVYEVLGETLPVSDPNQLVPINDAVSPATEAWYIRRVAEGQMIALDEGTRGGARRHRASAWSPCWPRWNSTASPSTPRCSPVCAAN